MWSWDATWLGGPVKGQYYYLVMMVDIYLAEKTLEQVRRGEMATHSLDDVERDLGLAD